MPYLQRGEIHSRQDEEREECRGHETSDHHDRERLLDLGSHPTTEQDGEETQHGTGSGHELRPQALDAGQTDSLIVRMPFCDEVTRLRQ